jgi:hypothetical protein
MQQIVGILCEHVKAQDVQGQCYQKGEGGKEHERQVLKGEPDALDMERKALAEVPNSFKHKIRCKRSPF